ncbi:MAG: histidine phosphatase family protein [Rhodobacteraceae bacterium]|jgi:phosphohistidine phosphatase|nr:histidine phosphatase family protein [Alphaproteobacteria bacterium]MBT8475666.1 histidine phosphatase family protein [Alphaproteobacteria bacterium]NNK65342.1 histidine phosphatase family protein [Paracoccaceae bacterium]
MSLTLILTRHAKSSWHDATLDDFDRPLNGRGKKSAAAIGVWLAERDLVPGEVYVSGARRTVDTWSGIAAAFPSAPPMRSDPALYHASAPTILRVLRTATAPIAMVIAHNPGIGEFAERIVSEPPDDARFLAYPTGATSVIQFPATDWHDVDWAQGQIVEFLAPRDIV